MDLLEISETHVQNRVLNFFFLFSSKAVPASDFSHHLLFIALYCSLTPNMATIFIETKP